MFELCHFCSHQQRIIIMWLKTWALMIDSLLVLRLYLRVFRLTTLASVPKCWEHWCLNQTYFWNNSNVHSYTTPVKKLLNPGIESLNFHQQQVKNDFWRFIMSSTNININFREKETTTTYKIKSNISRNEKLPCESSVTIVNISMYACINFWPIRLLNCKCFSLIKLHQRYLS